MSLFLCLIFPDFIYFCDADERFCKFEWNAVRMDIMRDLLSSKSVKLILYLLIHPYTWTLRFWGRKRFSSEKKRARKHIYWWDMIQIQWYDIMNIMLRIGELVELIFMSKGDCWRWKLRERKLHFSHWPDLETIDKLSHSCWEVVDCIERVDTVKQIYSLF